MIDNPLHWCKFHFHEVLTLFLSHRLVSQKPFLEPFFSREKVCTSPILEIRCQGSSIIYIETKSYKVTVEEAGLVFMMRIIERSDDFLRQFVLGKGARGLLASVEDLAKAEPSQFSYGRLMCSKIASET